MGDLGTVSKSVVVRPHYVPSDTVSPLQVPTCLERGRLFLTAHWSAMAVRNVAMREGVAGIVLPMRPATEAAFNPAAMS